MIRASTSPPATPTTARGRTMAVSAAVSLAVALLLTALGLPGAVGMAGAQQLGAATSPTRHVSVPAAGFSFDLPLSLRPLPVSLLKGKAGANVRFFAARARRDGVVVQDVIVSVYPYKLLISVAFLRAQLGASTHRVDVSTATTSFGRVMKGTVTLTTASGLVVHSVAYLFHRGSRTYAVAFNGLSAAGDRASASVVMGSWGT